VGKTAELTVSAEMEKDEDGAPSRNKSRGGEGKDIYLGVADWQETHNGGVGESEGGKVGLHGVSQGNLQS